MLTYISSEIYFSLWQKMLFSFEISYSQQLWFGWQTRMKKDGSFDLNYGSINNNWGRFKKKVHLYDYKVASAEDLAKLYLEPHMAKFTGEWLFYQNWQ